ncbi:hypothetical protein GCM10010168_76450 [Actinoplanes ianthinogenes]|uniref:PH domain-containing protein n=1 Tax=Actinoplanes ianthinogenes TaxID=122358 RepID=A0ABM7M9X9_9ACTN|nr:hypothetical protein [Actinoplanes ianthinogenes]BCJ48429.1 hypothetical protein Aiant_90860 [Actinoplanes ianthinogenes]GGR46449.1 hypothetical protein GCM10010168_76450 [Actinoplanes ianthinogenes]
METDLLPGEGVLWEGRPVRHLLFRATDVFLIPLSLVWCGIVVYWEAGIVLSGGPALFALWGLLFVLAGLYLVFARFIIRAVASRRTRYTITTSRLLIHRGWSGTRLTTAYLTSLPPPVITEQSDGSGNLAFGAFPGITDAFTTDRRYGFRVWSAEPSRTLILWSIPHVRLARDLATHAQHGA